MPRILTICPVSGQTIATHAAMTPAAFARMKSGLAVYCAACEQTHVAERSALWLEGSGEPAVLIARHAAAARSNPLRE